MDKLNITNMKHAIAIMERAKLRNSVCMLNWQIFEIAGVASETEEDLHKCGNKACFAGHLAISPEWVSTGGYSLNGCPKYGGEWGGEAIAKWLDIRLLTADCLVHGRCDIHDFSIYYNKPWNEVNADDVLEKLNLIITLENEEEFHEELVEW